jgi:hypothetical protein
MYNASLAFTKFSILLQYLRIFPARSFRLACFVVGAVVATYSSWAIVSGYVNCVPVAKFWNHDLPGSCLSFEAVWFFNASMNIATDVTLLILPMPLLAQLQLPRMQKIALMGVFAIGILYVLTRLFACLKLTTISVVITSILRLSSLRTVAMSPDTSCMPHQSPPNSNFANNPQRQQRWSRLLDRRRMQRRHYMRLSPLPPTHHQPHLPQTALYKQLQGLHNQPANYHKQLHRCSLAASNRNFQSEHG